MKRSILLITLFLACRQTGIAQHYTPLWHTVEGQVASSGKQVLHPLVYRTFQTSEETIQDVLAGITDDASALATLELPRPDGTYRTFHIWQNELLPGALQQRYPGIYALTATATDDHRVTAKIDYTPYGFHAMIFDGDNSYLIDPYSDIADGNYIAYYKHDYPRPAGTAMTCEVLNDYDPGGTPMTLTASGLPALANKVNGAVRHTYRLALACTGEYAVAVAGANPSKANVLAKMVTSINRVNGVYERELAYTLQLIPNTDDIIYLDGGSDPYTNNNGPLMLGENQANLTSVIGLGNFDIGHVFSTGGGGIAQKRSVCQPGTKAQGVTGRPSPVGDAFDIDYVVHEIGHQFGGEHTFNYNSIGGSCLNNAVQSAAYEPGSGSTIMAYAGICGASADYAAHSDDYFHTSSLELITNYVSGTSCGAVTASPNTNASLPAYTATYNIPYRTPFELTGPEATDPTAGQLTYTWEERDLGDFGKTIAATRLRGPLFRPYPPTNNKTRIFPKIENVLTRTYATLAEKLPDTSRTLAFRYAQRDIYQGFGCWNIPDDSIQLNVIYTGTPFSVTSPTGTVSWAANSTQQVRWEVGGTTNPPISCANVDIYLSVDGGLTFPYTLATGLPNNGVAQVTIPNVTAAAMRVKVKGAGNVFFGISGTDGVGVPRTTLPEIIISPVPASNSVFITARNVTESLRVRVLNALGQLVWQGNVQQSLEIPVNAWAKGVYYLQLRNNSDSIHINRTLLVN